MEKPDSSEETVVFQKQLIEAVAIGDIRNLRDICSSLPKEFNINFEFRYEERSETLIHLAVSKSVEILNVLLEKGANVQVKSHEGRTLLHVACMKGNVAAVKRLMEIGQVYSLINAVTHDGETAIHLACSWPAEMMKCLKENGADIHMKTKKSENALHLACWAQNVELVRYLLENVPDSLLTHAVTCDGIDPFSIVCSRYMHGKQRKIFELLLSHGYSFNSVDRNGSTLFMNAVVSNDYELAEYLCKHGANVNLGTYGNSYKAIHWASEQDCNVKMIKLLIFHGANINEIWRHGQRPIHLALKHSKTENARVLLDAGADVSGYIRHSNPRFSYIPTLCLAAFQCPSLVPQFLARGANPNEVHSTSGLSVLGILIENGASREMLKSVIQAGANINKGRCENTAIQCCENLEQIFAFLESGIPVPQIESHRKESLLLMAISDNYHDTTAYDAVSRMLSLGSNPNYAATGNDSALILSLKKQFWKIVNLLISKGVDIHHKGVEGNTALHVCCQKGVSDVAIVEQLLTAGAPVNVENNKGFTPLLDVIMRTCDFMFHFFNSRQNIKASLIRCLLNHGADVNNVFPTTSESTLYHVCLRGDSETTKLLIDAGYDVNKLEKNGRAPIFACLPIDSCRKTDTIKILLENGAAPYVSDENGTFLLECVFQQLKQLRMHNYPYHSATRPFRTRNDDLASELRSVFRLLLLYGADPNGANAGQDSLLLQAIKRSDMEDVVKTLIEFGADVCHVGENQKTAFEECLNNEDGLVLSTARRNLLFHLIEANFPLNKPLVMGNYPLELVLMYENTDSILQNMFSKGVDPNTYKEGNEPPLVLSVKTMRWLITLTLMEAGADLFVKTKDGKTAIDLFYEIVFYDELICCSWDPDSTRKIIKSFEFAKNKMEDTEEDEMKKIEVEPLEKRDGDHISMEPPTSFPVILSPPKHLIPPLVCPEVRHLYQNQRGGREEANTCCEIIKAFIEKNETSVNNKTPAGLNPLTVAVKLGSTSLVNFLLEKKADPNCMDHMNDTPLSLALIRRDEEMVRSLIKARANVNHCGVCPGGIGKRQSLLNRLLDENGYTTHLSKRVLVSLAQFLIENGTSVNHDEEGNDSPLIQAVRLPSYDLVDSLLAHGANVNHPGKNRSTALHECFRDELLVLHRTDSYEDMDVIWNMSESDVHVYGDPTTDIFQCLIEAGASVNSQTDHGDTPIHLAIKGNYFELTSKMLNKDFNPNIQNCDGTTCLMLVVNRHHNLTQHLLNIGADPSIKDNEGNTTLHHFCSVARETVILNILLKSGSDINALNNKGYSPLNTMIEEKAVLNTQDVLELLAQNADPNICVDGANSPLINSLLRWKLTIAECLLNAGVNVNHVGESRRTALHTLLNLQLPDGIEDEVVAIVRCLLIAAADVNFADISGRRPLEIVVDLSKKNWDEVKILELTTTLINHGAKYNDYEKGDDSLLHMAVDNGLQEVVDFLVRNGADINHRGKNQQIPLHRYTLKARKSELPFADRRLFSHQKPLTIMDNLLCMIEDPDVEDEYGDTPLNLVSHIHTDDFRKLLKAGADPLHKGKENVNAYENCIMSEEVELLEVLLQEKGLICITDSLFSDFWNLSTRCDGKLYERVMLPMLSTNDDIDLNRENSSGDTPLTFFCQRNATEVISKLLERGADINLTTTTGRSALHSVLDLPDNPTKLSTIAVLMSNNPDLEGKDASGETVLQKTIEKYFGLYRYRGSKCLCTFMEHLLNAGATCDQSDLTSVLQSASERQHFSLMTAAVKRGADLFNKKNGKGVLHRCWPQTFKDEVDLSSMLEECIAYINTHKQLGGCLDEVDDMGNTPLLAYVKSDLYAKGKVCEDLSDEVVASLATSKDVVCKADVANVSPLHITASRRRLNSMKILVNKGADLFSKDKVENSCLHNCLFSNEGHLHVVDMVRYILENGISPNEDNKRLDTSLFLIIQRSEYHTEDDVSTILELLIKHGANPNQGKSYRNPLVTAIQKFDIRSTAILLKNGANVNELSEGPTALHVLYRCFSHSYSTINENIYTMQRLLLKKEMNLNAKDIEGKTVLHLAVIALSKSSTEYTEAVKLIQELMKRGADVNATDNRNLSALCICCKSGYYSKTCIKLGKHLLKAGADTLKGCTLNLALKRTPKADLKDEWKTFILQLVANGASTNARLGSSSTPSLILAIKVKDMDIVKALLEHGADSNAFDYIGTSLIHACRLHAKHIISLLLQHGCSINERKTMASEYTHKRNPLKTLVKRMIEDDSYVRISRTSGKMTAQIDLTLFNLFVCGGFKFLVPTRERYTGSSVLAKLIKAGYFKAAEILLRCGYNFKKDVEFENLNFSSIDAPTIRIQGKRYKQVNHENAKTKFQDVIKKCEVEPFSLASLCRKTTRQHLVAVHEGSEIETKIKSLPLPNIVIEYLNYRDYTQEYEEFDVDYDSKS